MACLQDPHAVSPSECLQLTASWYRSSVFWQQRLDVAQHLHGNRICMSILAVLVAEEYEGIELRQVDHAFTGRQFLECRSACMQDLIEVSNTLRL